MIAVTDAELVEAIKTRLSITGDFHNDLILAYAEDAKAFLLSGGVSQAVIDSDKAVGAIARGVMDLWNFGAGDGKFSTAFYQRMIQLSYIGDDVGETIADILNDRINNIGLDEREYEYVTKSREIVSYNIPDYARDGDKVEVFVNGLRLTDDEYIIDGSTLTIIDSIDAGQSVHIVVRRVSV